MSSDALAARADPMRLSLEELVAIQPRHLRGKLARGRRGPEGERPGRGRAQSLDFEGLSPYELGDDIRSIDWKASLRAGNTITRRFAAASHRARVLAVDLKPSIYFGTDERLMAKTACLTAAWLAWAANMANEPVGLAAPDLVSPPRRGRKQVMRLLDELLAAYDKARSRQPAPVDYDAVAGVTAQGDEICLICEPPTQCGDLISVARALSGARILRLFLVEDVLTARPPPAGRYPVRTPDGGRTALTVKRPSTAPDDRIALLADAGWRVERARDLLPMAGRA